MGKRYKELILRILAGMLAATLCVGAGISASASSGGGISGGDGQQQTSGSANASDSAYAWSMYHQGYVFYVVDQDFNCVSDMHAFIFGTPDCTGYNVILSPRGGDSAEWHIWSISDLRLFCGVPESTYVTVPYWDGSHGEEFREWFLGGAAGTAISRPITSGTSGGSSTGAVVNPAQTPSQQPSSSGSEISATDRTYLGYYSRYSRFLNADSIYDAVELNTMLLSDVRLAIEAAEAALQYGAAIRASYPEGRTGITADELYYGAMIYHIYSRTGQLTDATALAVWLCSHISAKSDILAIATNNTNSGATTANQSSGNSASVTNPLKGTASTLRMPFGQSQADRPDNSLLASLQTGIFSFPMAGGSMASPAANITSIPGFWNMRNPENDPDALTALMRKDGNGNELYYLIAEPVFFLWSYWGGVLYEEKPVLGTTYNLSKHWVNMNGGSTRGFYTSLWCRFMNCLTVIQERPALKLNGRNVVPTSYAVEAADALPINNVNRIENSNEGYAMQIYVSADVNADARTSTCDETIAEDGPHDPPNDNYSGEPFGGSDTTETHNRYNVNIVKFYVEYTEDADGTESASRTNTNRRNTPITIAIEDEFSYNGYKLKDWFVSDERDIIPNNISAVYEEYKSSLHNTQTGTNETTVTLTEYESTLYVLLEKRNTDTGSLGADWIISESQISRAVTMNDNTVGSSKKLGSKQFTLSWQALATCAGHTVQEYTDNGYWCNGSGGNDENGVYQSPCSDGHTTSTWHSDYEWVDTSTKVECTLTSKDLHLALKLHQTINSDPVRADSLGSYMVQSTRSEIDRAVEIQNVTNEDGTEVIGSTTSYPEGTALIDEYNYKFVIHRKSIDTVYQYQLKNKITELEGLGYTAEKARIAGRASNGEIFDKDTCMVI